MVIITPGVYKLPKTLTHPVNHTIAHVTHPVNHMIAHVTHQLTT